MRLVAAFGLAYLAWSWFRIARDFAGGVARNEWLSTASAFRGQRDAVVYQRSSDPNGFWLCTAIKVAIHSMLTLLLLIMVLEA